MTSQTEPRSYRRVVVALLVAILVAIAGVGVYVHTHHECVDGSYGTPDECQQIQYGRDANTLVDTYGR
jgi:hypothetical protein